MNTALHIHHNLYSQSDTLYYESHTVSCKLVVLTLSHIFSICPSPQSHHHNMPFLLPCKCTHYNTRNTHAHHASRHLVPRPLASSLFCSLLEIFSSAVNVLLCFVFLKLANLRLREGPALSITTTEGPPPSSSASSTPEPSRRRGHRPLSTCPASMHPGSGNALRHRDILKRYILTFLKRDGHIRTYVRTI